MAVVPGTLNQTKIPLGLVNCKLVFKDPLVMAVTYTQPESGAASYSEDAERLCLKRVRDYTVWRILKYNKNSHLSTCLKRSFQISRENATNCWFVFQDFSVLLKCGSIVSQNLYFAYCSYVREVPFGLESIKEGSVFCKGERFGPHGRTSPYTTLLSNTAGSEMLKCPAYYYGEANILSRLLLIDRWIVVFSTQALYLNEIMKCPWYCIILYFNIFYTCIHLIFIY